MKISRDYSSPNFEIRKNNESPNKVILHYTGMKDTNSALKKLCSSQSKVSSHYLINRDGKWMDSRHVDYCTGGGLNTTE